MAFKAGEIRRHDEVFDFDCKPAGVVKQVTDLTGQIRGMMSRICPDMWVADLAGLGFVSANPRLFLASSCESGGRFAVEPGAGHGSDEDFHQSHHKPNGHDVSGENMESNRHDRSQQIPKAPDCRAGAQRGLCPGAVAWANGCVEPDGEDAHQKTPGQKHQEFAAPYLPAQRPHCGIHIFGKYRAVQSEFKNVDDHPGDESPEDHPVPVDLSHGLLLRMEIWLIVPPRLGGGKRTGQPLREHPAGIGFVSGVVYTAALGSPSEWVIPNQGDKLMPAFSGSFSGNVKVQTAITLSDQSNHELNLAEIGGTQETSDEKWNNAAITYWGTSDVVDGKGSQSGYFVNDHGADGRDWGTFEGKVASSGAEMTVEGTWQYTGGDGKFKGITGGGKFTTRMTSPREVQGTWQGTYELASAKAHAR